MYAKQIEAYCCYHKQYPDAIILFHLEGRYVAIFNDERTETFPDDDIARLSALGDDYKLQIIEYRNDNGELDFPDIQQIQADIEKDY